MNKREKKEAALNLADSARLEHLRQLGKSGRSEEEEREFSRLYQKSRRLVQRALLRGAKSPYDKFETAQEFWDANRLTLKKKELDKLLEAQERVLDIEFWMMRGFKCDPSDPDYVSLDEGLEVITEHVASYGLIHDDPVGYKQHHVLRDVNLAARDISGFFNEPEVFAELLKENDATEVYVRFGIRTALGAYAVRTFKQRIDEHERSKTQPDVRRAHLAIENDCWLCNQWWRSQEGQTPQAGLDSPTATA